MDNAILIDNERLCFLKATETLEQAQYWADILVPRGDYLITDASTRKAFSAYTHYELRLLYANTVGDVVSENIKYSKLVEGIQKLASDLILDETDLSELKKMLGHEKAEPTTEPVPEKKGRRAAPGAAAKPVSRPKEGSMTGKVWDIADSLRESLGEIPARQTVIDAATAAGVNSSTASTQYGKWKKHLNNQAEQQ